MIHIYLADPLFVRLSTGAIVGISIGAVLLALLAFFIIFRRLWPSINFLRNRTPKQKQLIQPFEYPIVGVIEPTSGPGLTSGHAHGPTLPSTNPSPFYDGLQTGGYTPQGKYRPDLVSAPQNVRSLFQGPRWLDATTTPVPSTNQASSSSGAAQHQQPQSSWSPSSRRGNGEVEEVPPPQYELGLS